jgi:ribosomal protein L11 methylase PrmA
LDFGCGVGAFLSVCKKNGWNTFGIEPDPDARKVAKDTNDISSASSISDFDSAVSLMRSLMLLRCGMF